MVVKKISRRGLYSSTGNTIRDYRHNPALRQYQKYGCLVMGAQADIKKNPKAKSIMSDIHTHIPQTDSGVEFSLNKRRRWELPSYLKQKVCAEANSEHVEITVMEHTLTVPKTGGIVDMDTCNSYYNNVGPVTECVSKSEMTVESAKQGHRDQDHLSKLERRFVKNAEREGRTEMLDEEDGDDEGSDLARFEFHIAYGAATDGNLLKELATKGFAKNIKKNRNVSGWSKRFVPLGTLDMADKFEEENYADCDVYDYEDDAAYEFMHHPHDITLSDFLKPAAKPKKCKQRTSDYIETEDLFTNRTGRRVVYVDNPYVSSGSDHPTPYTPSYTQITVKHREMEATNLMKRFSEIYEESACTPRIVTLDLTDKLDSEYDGRFYLVLVFQSEGQSTDTYRVYCTGTGVTSSSSQIRSLYSVSEYSLTDLVCHALSHYRELLIVHGLLGSRKLKECSVRRPPYDSILWGVKSAYLEDITVERRKADREMAKKNIAECLESLDDFVLVLSHTESADNYVILCRSCGTGGDNMNFALLSCQHFICNRCWSSHIRNCINSKNSPITCPEEKCGITLDPIIVLALVEYELYTKYELHLTEYLLFSQSKANWCPNERCSRVLYCGDELADRDDPVPVQCDCGTECCFRCLGEPHWPLSCSLVKPYHQRLIQSGLKDLLNMSKFELGPDIEKKHCPYCNNSIDTPQCYPRRSGRYFHAQTFCKECKNYFCWSCGNTYQYILNRWGTFYRTLSRCHKRVYLPEETTLTELNRAIEDTGNVYLRDAGFHRLYKSSIMKKQRSHGHRFLKNLNSTAKGKIHSIFGDVRIRRYLWLIDKQIVATRHILENCCALNSFQKGEKFCVQPISEVTFHLTMLEAQLNNEKSDKEELQRLVNLYNLVKLQTSNLVSLVSEALQYVKPTMV